MIKNQILLASLMLFIILGCKKSNDSADNSVDIKVESTQITNLTAVSVKVGGMISGAEPIKERGVCWGTESNPTIEGESSQDIDASSGDYSVKIKGLNPETIYYVRAYAITKSGKAIYGNSIEVVTKAVTALAESNSYLIGLDDAVVIPVSRANKTSLGNQISTTEALSAELIWMDNYDVIDEVRVVGEGSGAKLVVSTGNVNGNAVVVVKNASKEIKWSWHIWVTEEAKSMSNITLPSGIKMMDRNLGAINKTIADIGSVGLQYQFGRKDPFTASTSFGTPSEVLLVDLKGENPTINMENGPKSLAYSVNNPSTFIKSTGIDWSEEGSISYWNNDLGTKTVYDPCPLGYKVPSMTNTEGLAIEHFNATQEGGYQFIYNNQSNFFPYTGYREGNGALDGTAFSGNLWFNSSLENFAFLTSYQNGEYLPINGSPRVRAMCVRCIEE